MDGREVVELFLTVFFTGVVLPVALDLLYATSVTGWSTTLKTVFYLVPVISIIGIIVGIIYYAVGAVSSAGSMNLLAFLGRLEELQEKLKAKFEQLKNDRRGGIPIMWVFVAILLFGILMPIAFTELLKNFNATAKPTWVAASYGTTVITLGALIPVMACIALIISIVKKFVG
jgi:hypothetical protein